MATQSLEREIKLAVDLRFVMPDLSTVASGLTVAPRPVLRLAATYYDTPDLRLLRRGITLRRRQDRQAGGENLWTLKLPARTDHAALARNEHSWPGQSSEIPEEARFLVRGLVRNSDLVPVAKLLTTRRRAEVLGAAGEHLLEVDDDMVAVVSGVRQGLRFREIELELGDVDPGLIDLLVSAFGHAGASVGEDRPKLDRAVGLGPRRTFALDQLGPDSTTEDLIRADIAAGIDRLLDHDPGLRVGGSDLEYVHQARVATRRLRSDLRTFSILLDPAWVTRTRGELRWLGGVLGAVRDADVLDENLTERAAGSSPEDAPALAAVRARLHRQREGAREDLRRAIEDDRYFDLVDDLSAAVAHLPAPTAAPTGPAAGTPGATGLEAPASCVLPTLLGRPWRRLRLALRAAGDHPTDDQLHQIRIRSKQLRYAAEAATPVLGRPVRQLAERAAVLQGALGDLHDALTAEAWLRQTAAEGTAPMAFAAGQLVAYEHQRQQELRRSWRGSLKRLLRTARHLELHA
jgi:CHAD domain-containing protein